MELSVYTFNPVIKSIFPADMLQRLKKKCGWEAYIMIIEILKRSLIGIAFGALYTFIALTIMKFNHIEGSVAEVWNHMLASFVLGIILVYPHLFMKKINGVH